MPYYPRRYNSGYRRRYSGYSRYNPRGASMFGHGDYKIAKQVRDSYKSSAKPAEKRKPSAGRRLAKLVGHNVGGGLYDLASQGLSSLKDYIGKIMGSGDYQMGPIPRNNVLMNDAQIPKFHATREAVTISHREYLGDLISSATAGAFSIQAFALNPGLASTLPWLSSIASNFQQYRINGMCFEFRSMSSDALNSVNTALGTVTFSTDYDSSEASFTNKQQMENTEYAVSCKPSVNMMHGIECARAQSTISELYVRTGEPPANYDKRMYDLGTTYIATQGCQGTSVNLGEIWVSYTVSFLKAVQQPRGIENLSARYRLVPAAAVAGAPVLLTGATVNFDNIGLTNLLGSGLSLSFGRSVPVGTAFQVTFVATQPLGLSAAPTLVGTQGCTVITSFQNDTVSNVNGDPTGGNVTRVILVATVMVTNNVIAPGLVFGAAVYGTVPTAIDLHVDQLNAVAYRV